MIINVCYDVANSRIVDSYNRQNEANVASASELSYDEIIETIINDASLKQALLDNIKS